MPSVASLPMYDLPALTAATDAWWVGLARAFAAEGLSDVPAVLDRETDAWHAPTLLFSQTCGYPLTHGLDDCLQVVATPVYGAPGCEGPLYRSVLVVRADDAARDLRGLAGRRVAINGRDSQSGFSALRHEIAPLAERGRFFSEVVETGAHGASLAAVAAGTADVAAIDCVSYALWARSLPERVVGLRVLAYTEAAPALPYVTAKQRPAEDLEKLRAGLRRACADPALATTRAALMIGGIEVLPRSAYDRIDEMEARARDLGYPDLP